MCHGSYRNGSAALIASTREPGGGAGAHHCCDYKQTFHLHDLTDKTILALIGCGFLSPFPARLLLGAVHRLDEFSSSRLEAVRHYLADSLREIVCEGNVFLVMLTQDIAVKEDCRGW